MTTAPAQRGAAVSGEVAQRVGRAERLEPSPDPGLSTPRGIARSTWNLERMKLKLTAALLVLFAALPSATPATAAARPTIRGTNVLEATRPASIEVRVPPGASIDTREQVFRSAGPNAALQIEGEGPFVGIVLDQQEEGGFRFKAGRWDSCEGGCKGRETFSYTDPSEGDSDFTTGEEVPRFLEIPAGNYRIYVISGGGPVSIRFNIRGLGGELRTKATQPASIDAQTMPVRMDVASPQRLWAAGSTFDSGERGFFISNFVIQAPELRDLRWGICAPNGPTAPPEEVSYGPQCTALASATGSGFFGTFAEPEMDRGYFLLQFSSFYDERVLPPNLTGERGLGMWFSTPSDVKDASAQAVFVSLDGASP